MREYIYKVTIICMTGLLVSCAKEVNHSAWQVKKEGIAVTVIHLKQTKNLRLFLKNHNTNEYLRTFKNLKTSLRNCEDINLAVNAGMYHQDYSPVGLYLENGSQLAPLNINKNLNGNFYLQPNGVFAWDAESFKVLKTEDYRKDNNTYQYATQSGPMLVIDGKINEVFDKESKSKKIRNGVGVADDGVYFVISNEAVTFYAFAQYFKDTLKTQNALYLDGTISAAYIPELKRYKQSNSLGPIIADIIDETKCQE